MAESLDDYRWLVSAAAQPCLEQWAGDEVTPSMMRDLRRHLTPGRARLVAEQLSLRQRARRKFPNADRMYLLPQPLEQATDDSIARYKSSTFPPGGRCTDLGCGLGGDSLGLARSRSLLAVDRDPLCCLFTDANLRAAGATNFTVCHLDAGRVDLKDFDFWHADPDRRPKGRRTVQTDAMSPPTSEIVRWLGVNPHAAIKWAPASPPPPDLPPCCEREWIGHSRSCQQQLIRSGALARHPGRRVATILTSPEHAPAPPLWSLVEDQSDPPAIAVRLGAYLVEPHPVILASGLADQWAAQQGFARCPSRVGYFTGDHPASVPAAASFRVLEQLPVRMPKIRGWLLEHHATVTEVKKRAVDLNPGKWLRALTTSEQRRISLIVFPFDTRPIAIVAERINP